MKQKNNSTRQANRRKSILQKSFLVISLIFSVLLMTQCRKIGDFWPPGHHHKPPVVGSTSFVTSLFQEAAKGAAGKVGGVAADWAMSALGLSAGSPDYNEQLNTIHNDLLLISTQLDGIQATLNTISGQLGIINCSSWENTLKNEKARIDDLTKDYSTIIATAAHGGIVSQNDLSIWVDKVLAEGGYTSQTPMSQILATIAVQVYVPPASGIIPACIQAIAPPAEGSVGTDSLYYKVVKLYTDYYAAYQVRGLKILNEALHYKAWKADGSPGSGTLSADSTSYVCANPNVVIFCNQAAANVNTMYNNLVNQLTPAGAPYTNEAQVMSYSASTPLLWPSSLEGFSAAAGNNCTYPLTSAAACGVTAGWFDAPAIPTSLNYNGYTGWKAANQQQLATLLAGWKTGTAGDYLSSAGFRNMENKIVIASNNVLLPIRNVTGYDKWPVIPFFDTDMGYNVLGGFVQNTNQFDNLYTVKKILGGHCDLSNLGKRYWSIDLLDPNGFYIPDRNGFYHCFGHARTCGTSAGTGNITSKFRWTPPPGWDGSTEGSTDGSTRPGTHTSQGKQFRWPVLTVAGFKCTNNRSSKNTGGVWTMCGADFTAWIANYYVTRPETCDNPGAGVTCTKL